MSDNDEYVEIRVDFNSVDRLGRLRSNINRADGEIKLLDTVKVSEPGNGWMYAIVEAIDPETGAVILLPNECNE